MQGPDEILTFWLDEVGPKGWYESDPKLDETIRARFHQTWQSACEGGHSLWLTHASGALAYIILTDQFPRNMFRSEGKAFSTDAISRAVAKTSIHKGWDLRIDPPARQFFYMPLMHSENQSDQDRCVRLMHERLQGSDSNLLHARAHREVIRKFGRFPHRNAALGRSTTAAESVFIDDGGYGSTVRALEAQAKAA
jgi:uncharacterized protein (DUF924 family)